MKDNALISVIVPCYNQAQYLDECLQSVLDQTYQNWECIIVNDGSPDNTEEIALQWTAKDSRFTYLKKENGGLSSARNAGIEVANGEWILPLDADDKIGNQYLELAEKEFDNGYTVIYCEAEFFGEKTGKWKLPEFNMQEFAKENLIFCSALYRKQDWLLIDGYDENMKQGLEDWEFWIRILANNKKVYCIPYVLFFYRIKASSMLTSLEFHKKEQVLKYIEKKHLIFFHEYLGSMHVLNSKQESLKKNIDSIEKKLQSTRYKTIDKFLSFLGK